MELVPALGLGWLNGWIPLCLFYSVFGILILTFPKDVIARLYDRSGWSRKQRTVSLIGKLLVLVSLGLIIFTPLKVGDVVFIVGSILFAIGLTGFVVALLNFKNTPMNQPATRGLYKISRNPQIVAGSVLFLGICVAIGSWAAMFVVVVVPFFTHSRVLAEEGSCLQQYGDLYRDYVKRVPRYFLFF